MRAGSDEGEEQAYHWKVWIIVHALLLLLSADISACLSTFSNWILVAEERWSCRKSFNESYYRNVAAIILSDAVCFLINPSFLVFKNKKTATSFITLNIIVVIVTWGVLRTSLFFDYFWFHLRSRNTVCVKSHCPPTVNDQYIQRLFCVSAALFIPHAMHIRRCILHIFQHYLINSMTPPPQKKFLNKKKFEHKMCVLIFSTTYFRFSLCIIDISHIY